MSYSRILGPATYAATPMLWDIYAVQQQYGANTTTRSGNTTYGFHSSAGRDVFDFNINTHPFVTIYDTGGLDQLDLSGFSQGSTVDLHDGEFSSVAGPHQQYRHRLRHHHRSGHRRQRQRYDKRQCGGQPAARRQRQ